jgi:hypothetical protein
MTINETPQRSTTIVGIAVAIIVIISIIGVWLLKSRSTANGGTRQVTYQVEASGGYAQIIYTTSTGVNTEAAILTTPFTKTMSIPLGTEVYLTASNPSQTGTISCKIKIDNKDWKESHGTHPVDSVACGGIVK